MFKLPWFRILPDNTKFNKWIFLPIALYFAKGMTWMDVWLGFGIESWIEYSLHRFVFHKYFPKNHRFHHIHPSVYGLTFLGNPLPLHEIIFLLPFAYFLTYFSLLFVTILWYMFVEEIHICIHRYPTYIPSSIKRLHDIHHKYPNKNFGVFGGLLFDLFCGTFMWKEDDATLSRKQKAAGSLKAT